MSYTKTTWVNNTTPINDTNLNKIEQGIYDNSLVVDAVTNTLNPTDTETYKTAELTEGQITDVIGVSDIVIKGQTEQDGTPTPSDPVDVNVVSGSNVINTSNKNLLNINNAIAFRACTIQLQNNSIKIITDGSNNAIVKIPCVLTAGNYYLHFESNANIVNVAFYNSNGEKIIANNPSSSKAITLSDNLAYININLSNVAGTYTLAFNKLYINLGSTDLSYEPHQGKELSLDLPVENLINLTNGTYSNNGVEAIVNNGEITLNGTANTNNSYINIPFSQTIEPNIEYTLSINNNFTTSNTSDGLRLSTNDDTRGSFTALNRTKTFTFQDALASNQITIRLMAGSTVRNGKLKVQLEQGSKANTYTPYSTEPIELCKIGNYQDYFYKSGSKWYLHKEIEKVVLNGSENWELKNNDGTNYCYSISSITDYMHGTLSNYGYSNMFVVGRAYGFDDALSRGKGLWFYSTSGSNVLYLVSTETSVANLKTWLASNNVTLYYILATVTDTEITDTTLISQLEAIYNAPLYEQTNITQTNNDLPMVLDITACKDNINGIKAFIRK